MCLHTLFFILLVKCYLIKWLELFQQDYLKKVGTISPKTILELSVNDIRAMGVSGKEAEYILKLAEDVNNDIYNFDCLSEMTENEIIAYLTQIKGVGKWTAEMIAEFTIGRLDIFSYDDVALQNGIKKAHGYKTLSKMRFERLRKKYTPYCSVASLYYYEYNDDRHKED